jgi:hypothetical protein
MSFIMYGICDDEGNVVKGDALAAHVNRGPSGKPSGFIEINGRRVTPKGTRKPDATSQFERTRELFAETRRLMARDKGKYQVVAKHEPEIELPEPVARWSRQQTTFRPMWRRTEEN